jgi:hypothetical protein
MYLYRKILCSYLTFDFDFWFFLKILSRSWFRSVPSWALLCKSLSSYNCIIFWFLNLTGFTPKDYSISRGMVGGRCISFSSSLIHSCIDILGGKKREDGSNSLNLNAYITSHLLPSFSFAMEISPIFFYSSLLILIIRRVNAKPSLAFWFPPSPPLLFKYKKKLILSFLHHPSFPIAEDGNRALPFFNLLPLCPKSQSWCSG